MTTDLKLVIATVLSLYMLPIFSLMRVSARAEAAARRRKRELNQSLINRRLS